MPDIEIDYTNLADVEAEILEARVRLAQSTSLAQVVSNEHDLADLELVRSAIVAEARRRLQSDNR